jgi:hypothetical protein
VKKNIVIPSKIHYVESAFKQLFLTGFAGSPVASVYSFKFYVPFGTLWRKAGSEHTLSAG